MPSEKSKVLSLRLAEELAIEMSAVARVDGQTFSGAVREAIANHVTERRGADDFQARLKRCIEEDLAKLERMVE